MLMPRLFLALRHVPLSLLHRVGFCLGWLIYGLLPSYRHRLRSNAELAGIHGDTLRAAVGHEGRLLAELPRIWFGSTPPPLQIEGQAVVERAVQSDVGIVYLTPHLGGFEVGGQWLADTYGSKKPLTVLFRPARALWMRPLLEKARTRLGMTAAPTNMAGVKQLVRALKAKHAVGLLPDQVPPDGQGVWIDYFGRPAYTMTLSARLANMHDVEVICMWSERLPDGAGFHLHFETMQTLWHQMHATPPPTPWTPQQINQVMEYLVLKCPEQYLWSYDRYKKPREISEFV